MSKTKTTHGQVLRVLELHSETALDNDPGRTSVANSMMKMLRERDLLKQSAQAGYLHITNKENLVDAVWQLLEKPNDKSAKIAVYKALAEQGSLLARKRLEELGYEGGTSRRSIKAARVAKIA